MPNRTDIREIRNDFDQASVVRDAAGRFLGQGGPGRKEKPETKILRRIRERLPEDAEEALKVLAEQLHDKDKRIAQGAAKIILERVVPAQTLQKSWTQAEESSERSIADILPQFGEFLRFKADQDSKAIDMDARDTHSPG